MEKVLSIYKPVGLTPLESIEKFREFNPEYKTVKLAYAGRLDPMAEGLLLVLVGDECKKRDVYQKLNKKYEFSVIAGFSTDTYDLLGIVKKVGRARDTMKLVNGFKDTVGEFKQTYPPYSSVRHAGKPLFWWARQGKINEIDLPYRTVRIFSLKYLGTKIVSKNKLESDIFHSIQKVKGDFRQESIKQAWQNFFQNRQDQNYTTFTFEAEVSSGTYIRSIVNQVSSIIEVPLCTLSIKRIQVGTFDINGCFKIE